MNTIIFTIASWVIFGLIVGTITHILVGGRKSGFLKNIFVGIVGGLMGGFFASTLLDVGIEGITVPGVGIAVIGALVILSFYNMFFLSVSLLFFGSIFILKI